MSSDYKRATRAGDDYQDLCGAEVLVEFLENPKRFDWVKLEAEDSAYLDDIVIKHSDGEFTYKQVKFTVDPENEDYLITWEWLLDFKKTKAKAEKKPTKKTCLIKKWASSLNQLKGVGKIKESSLLTNRDWANEIPIKGEYIDFDAIADVKVRQKIIEEIGSEQAAKDFFSVFRFIAKCPTPESLEDGLRRRFYKLGGDDHGWLNLQSEIRTWAIKKNEPNQGGKIFYKDTCLAALWNDLRGIPENFEVPSDFIIPSDDFHALIKRRLLEEKQGCTVIKGRPGAGKSTYLSFLIEELSKEKIPVIRHHYYLSDKDRTGDRFSFRVVAESLMYEIRETHSKALGSLDSKKPLPEQLSDWITACGKYYSLQSQPFIVVIDGLDHVWRERQSIEELTLLFEAILPTPDNVVLVIGTQDVPNEQIPQRLLLQVSRDEWQEIPFLSRNAVGDWTKQHEIHLEIPGNPANKDYFINEIADAFYEVSQGHPLHLRYSLKALIPPINVASVKLLPACINGDIESYYRKLIVLLSEDALQMLHLISACDFPWPKGGLETCLSTDFNSEVKIRESYKSISHLLDTRELGMAPFHSSLKVFVKNQADHLERVESLRPKIIDWLDNKAPTYWHWAYSWITKCDFGNHHPLLEGSTLDWTIDSIKDGYSLSQCLNILAKASWTALNIQNIDKLIEKGVLYNYLYNNSEYDVSSLDRLLFCQLRLKQDDKKFLQYKTSELNSFSDDELRILAEFCAAGSSPSSIPKDCYWRFQESLDEEAPPGIHVSKKSAGRIVEITCEFGAYLDKDCTDEIINYIHKVNIENPEFDPFYAYCQALYRLGSKGVAKLSALFKKELLEKELYELSIYSFRLSYEEGFEFESWLDEKAYSLPLVQSYLLILNRSKGLTFEPIKSDFTLLNEQETALYGNRRDLVRFFHSLFFNCLALTLQGKDIDEDGWTSISEQDEWLYKFCEYLRRAAVEIGKKLQAESLVLYSDLFQLLNDVSLPEGRWVNKESRFLRHIIKALFEITYDVRILSCFKGKSYSVDKDDLERALSYSYFQEQGVSLWLEWYIQNRRALFSKDAVQWFFNIETERLSSTIDCFSERFEDYAQLAQIATIHKQDFSEVAWTFIRKASACLTGYGYHKDTFLFDTLRVLEECNSASIGEPKKWIEVLSPMILHVTDYTDGDETRYLREELGRLIIKLSPELIENYYKALEHTENWDDVWSLINAFVKDADLSSKVNQSIARTALSTTAIETLCQREQLGDSNAHKILNQQAKWLGISRNSLNEKKSEKATRQQELELLYDAKASEALIQNWATEHFEGSVETAIDYLLNEKKPKHLPWSEKIYDRAFIVCLSKFGKAKAFPLIVKAHQDRFGWNWYEYKDESKLRFKKFAAIYPDRWYEFIQQTAQPSGLRWRYKETPSFGLSQLVFFLICVQQYQLAAQVAEVIVKVTLERSVDLVFPEARYAYS